MSKYKIVDQTGKTIPQIINGKRRTVFQEGENPNYVSTLQWLREITNWDNLQEKARGTDTMYSIISI